MTTAEPNWATSGLRGLGYAAVTLAWSIVGLAVLITGVSVTASLLLLVIGLPVWLGFAHAVRWTTWVDRRLAGWQRGQRVRASYRRPDGRGFGPALRAVSADPQTWRDLAWLALASIAGFALSLVVITTAGVVLAWVSLPAWYWAVSDPSVHAGLTNLGVAVVDTPAEAVAVSGIALALVPLALLLARGVAAWHAGLAARLLG
jgi:Putative sensor